MSEPMNGRTYLRALVYALRAVPSDPDQASLQHVTFHHDRVTGADQSRRHDAYLPAQVDTVSVSKSSAQELVMALEYALRVSKRRAGTFSVTHAADQEVIIEYGARHPLIHQLQVVDVGKHPETTNDWVPADAALNPDGLGHLDCGHDADALKWRITGDKDPGTSQVRGGQDGGPVRRDIVCAGRMVATAFILPMDHPPAELKDSLPLFGGETAPGRSNLDLDLTGDGGLSQAQAS